jgi:hypothetical protein
LVQVLHPGPAAAAAVGPPAMAAPTSSLAPWPAGSFTIASASCLLLPVTAAFRTLHSTAQHTAWQTAQALLDRCCITELHGGSKIPLFNGCISVRC